MKLNKTGVALDRNARIKENENWSEIENNFNNIVDEVSEEAFNKVVDSAKLNWKEPVNSFSDLPSTAEVGETRMVRETQKVYRYGYDGQWKEIQEIDVGPLNEVDNRLTAQLAQKAEQTEIDRIDMELSQEINRIDTELSQIDTKTEENKKIWGNKSNHPLFFEGNGIERQVSIPKFKPVLYENNPILENTTPNLVDGEFFFTIVHAEEVLDNPIDKFYGYAATHDGDSIWLATAPTPEGPWTWQKPVITVGIGNQYTGHVSSPNVLIHEDKFYMYYHGVYGDNVQPTSLAISSDGENFVTHEKFPLIPTGENRDMSFYGQSVSYFRVVKDGNLFIGVFQANNNLRNLQANNSVTVSIGYALSEDGINWRVGKKPLISNPIGERGYFGPGIIKLFGKWCLFFMNNTTESIYMAASDVLEPNSFEVLGEVIPKGTGDWNSKRVEFQDFLLYDNKLYIFFDGVRIDNNRGSLGVATFDWRNVE